VRRPERADASTFNVDALTENERAELAILRAHKYGYERFEDFIKRVAPRYWPIPPHLRPLVDLIERSRHEQVRSLVSMPPRHGKTVTFMLGLAWRCLLDPACQNFYTSFSGDLSSYVGRTVRNLVVDRLGIPLDKSSKSVEEWNTVFGGGLKSTSLGGSIMGRGANGGLVVVDDILKGWMIAQSEHERDRAFNYIAVDVMSRLEGGGSMIICGTRWHEDDPIGRIIGGELAEENFGVINLPAVGDEYGNAVDERDYPELARPLWTSIDSRFPNNAQAAMDWYRRIRGRGELYWWALYQGVPRAESLKMFLEPGVFRMPLVWQGKRGCLVLDPAASQKTTADYSALGAFAMDGFGDESTMFVNEVLKTHITQPQMAREALSWQRRYKLYLAVEAVAGFAGIPQMLREAAPGIRLIELKPGEPGWVSGDKKMRAVPVSGAWNRGRVLVPVGVGDDNAVVLDANGKPYDLDWVNPYVKVVRAFTGAKGEEDDVVDITAHAWNLLYRELKTTPRGNYGAAF
jgi:phage terminase large subunit-like protein